MSNLAFSMLLAVTQTMLGILFYPLLILAVVLTIGFFVLLIREKGIISKRLVQAEIVGFFGGWIGLWAMLMLSESRITDIGGPIDWIIVFATYVVNFVGTAILYYTLMGWIGCKKCNKGE